MNYRDRSECGLLNLSDVGRQVHLFGWVDSLRDHGDVLFIHLRDRSGIVQVVFSPEFTDKAICRLAADLRNEFCINVSGKVVKRAEGTENPCIETGGLEIITTSMTILSKSSTLPFSISEKAMLAGTDNPVFQSVSEDLKLQYRYLDLRRPTMQDFIIKRHKINKCIRKYLDDKGFVDVETPMLTKSTETVLCLAPVTPAV